MKTVIVGGVAGGASAAARLRRLSEDMEIILFERGEFISFANCGLPYYIGGDITDSEDLTLQTPDSMKARFNIDVRVLQEVIRIDTAAKLVEVRRLGNGETYQESYDKLILSPGARPSVPPIAGVDAPNVFTLRTIPDTLKIKAYIEENNCKTAVIIGGGFIGLEMAENLKRAGLCVTVIEALPQIATVLDEDLACDLTHYLRSKELSIYTSTSVSDLSELDGDIIILSVGVKPESDLAAAAGLTLSDRGAIIVDSHMRTSDEHIYAVGDAILIRNFVSGAEGYIPLAGPANKQGRIAADNVAGIPSRYKGTQGTSILKLFDLTAAATGLNERALTGSGISYDKIFIWSSSNAVYYPGAGNMSIKVLFELTGGKILGAQIVGFKGVDKRIDVLAAAIRAGMTAMDLTELELAYAPPFSSAKDPVNMAGYMIENLLTDKIKQHHWHDVKNLTDRKDITLLDVRTDAEYANGHIENTVCIPLDALRERIQELDLLKPVYVNCQSGLRSYIACRILKQKGFDCSNLAGGYRLYASMKKNAEFVNELTHPCGLKAEK
ncbi:MAG: FAD-dependent oxidoreductase [Clostridiales bacterium]|nr:FAD-dependent oxidoreductase [Clostridiales bacterium]